MKLKFYILSLLMVFGLHAFHTNALAQNPNTQLKQTANTTTLPFLLGCAAQWTTGGWAYSATNFYGRTFALGTYNPTPTVYDSFLLKTAVFEILEGQNQGTTTNTFDIKIHVYRVNGAYTIANRTLVKTINQPVTINASAFIFNQVFTVNVEERFGANETIALEIETPMFNVTNLTYVMPKTYNGGELATSYWHAPDCAIAAPVSMATQWGAALAGLGYSAPALRLEGNGEYFVVPEAPVYSTFKDTICAGAVNIPYSINPVPHATSYEWDYTGGGVTISGTGTSVNLSASLAATSGYLRVKAKNYYGESDWTSRYIQVDSIFNINLNISNPTVCLGDTVTLSGPLGYTTYRWEPPTGITILDAPITQASPANSHSYTLVVEDQYGCKGIGSTFVSINPGPTIHVNPSPLQICKDSILVNLSGAASYSWAPTNGLANPTSFSTLAKPATTTNYIITATDNMGCSSETPVTIKVNPVINGSISRNGNILTATPGMAGYIWYLDDAPIVPTAIFEQYNMKVPGRYKVLFTDINGCQFFSNEIAVTDIVSVRELDADLVKLYPNPTKDNLNIETDLNVQFQLLSIDGKVMIPTTKGKVVSMSDLAIGMYYLVVEDLATQQKAMFKIVKGE